VTLDETAEIVRSDIGEHLCDPIALCG